MWAKQGYYQTTHTDLLRSSSHLIFYHIYNSVGPEAVVSSLDLDNFLQIYQVREVLETLAARMAAPTVSDDTLRFLTNLEEEMERASRHDDLSSWLNLDLRFHYSSYQSCNNPRLLSIIISLLESSYYIRLKYMTICGKARYKEQYAEQTHRKMIEALTERDGKQYARLIKDHLRETTRSVKESLRERSLPPDLPR